jgi:hypothetical protein
MGWQVVISFFRKIRQILFKESKKNALVTLGIHLSKDIDGDGKLG